MSIIFAQGGPPFEIAHKINAIIFDKTGTLTMGKPRVTDEIDLVEENTIINNITVGDKKDRLLRLAAIAELGSEHPLGER